MNGNKVQGLFGALLLAAAIAACEGADTLQDPVATPQFGSSGPVLVECPTDNSLSAEGEIGSLGGDLTLKNHRLALPKLAVVGPHRFRVEEAASQYMELRLQGDGQESFGFEKPVSVTLDYSRCTRSNIDHTSLTVWKVDPVTKALLKHMGGVDDPTTRTITFTTDSLSAYVIAD